MSASLEASRVRPGAMAHELRRSLNSLDQLTAEYATRAGIVVGFSHLLRLRASQLNQCAFCVRLHARDAARHGESPDRIALVAAWRDTDYFTEQERASLALVEAVTNIADAHVPDALYAEAAAVLSPEEIAAVVWIAAVIGTWNRISTPGRPTVAP